MFLISQFEHSLYAVSVTLVLYNCALANSPTVLSAHVNDRVFIPCFNTKDQVIAAWEINDDLYAVSELFPELYIQKYPHGILIFHTTITATGKYNCFSHNTSTYQLQYISSVQFDVSNASETGNNS